jgi:uncharacterized membrane protein
LVAVQVKGHGKEPSAPQSAAVARLGLWRASLPVLGGAGIQGMQPALEEPAMSAANILASAIIAFMLAYCVQLVRSHPVTTNWSASEVMTDRDV